MTKDLEALWTKYCGACALSLSLSLLLYSPSPLIGPSLENEADLERSQHARPHYITDPSQPNEISMDGTMQYCADLDVDPSEVIMLALAWFTKAPTMGRFSKREWVEAWQAIGSVSRRFISPSPWGFINYYWCKEL